MGEEGSLASAAERIRGMLVGGIPIEDRLVRKLAATVDRSLRGKFETALLFRAKIVGLTRDERRAVLAALENAPAELQEVRDLFVADDSWRSHERLH